MADLGRAYLGQDKGKNFESSATFEISLCRCSTQRVEGPQGVTGALRLDQHQMGDA